MLHTILNFLNSIPSEVWEILAGAFVVSPVAASLIKWFSIDSDKKKFTLALTVAMLVGALGYLRGMPAFSGWFALVQGALVFAVNQPFYRLAWKSFSAHVAAAVVKAKSLNIEVRRAKEPQEAVDFSH